MAEDTTFATGDDAWLWGFTASDVIIATAVIAAVLIWVIGGRRKKADMERRIKRRRELEAKMHVPTRDDWRLEDLKPYTGGPEDDQSPILFAAKDTVFNVWRGRHFYGCEGPYFCFAGKDATIMLALELLEDPTPEQEEHPYSRSELVTLDDWFSTMAWKYDNVGTLAPGEGTWEREAERKALWEKKLDWLAPPALAAGMALLAAAAATTEQRPPEAGDGENRSNA